MDSAKLNDWMQVVGIFAVVASLIFVGLQMNQTQAIAIANQYQERAALNIEFRYSQIQNDTVLAINGNRLKQRMSELVGHAEAKAQIESSSPEEVGFRYAAIMLTLLMNDNNHFQYQSGFLTESTWQAYRAELKTYMLSDLFRYIWEDTRHQYRADFQMLVEQLITENENAP